MRTLELTCLTHIPGHRLWCIARFGTKVELVVTEIPDHLPQWDITNAAMEAEFAVQPARRKLALDVADAEVKGPLTVTFSELKQAKSGGPFTLMLRPKMGRPPKQGLPRDRHVDLRLTGVEEYVFGQMGHTTWLYDQIERKRVELEQAGDDIARAYSLSRRSSGERAG